MIIGMIKGHPTASDGSNTPSAVWDGAPMTVER
jgi:hypothetical protein